MHARLLLLALPLAAGACHRHDAGHDLEKAESAQSRKDADPALTGALADQIMVDPDLTGQANEHAARAAATPLRAPVPPASPTAPATGPVDHAPAATPISDDGRPGMTLGQLAAARQQHGPSPTAGGPACRQGMHYSAGWAAKLPATFPVYPEGQVSEAAGTDSPGCALRVVSFTTGASAPQVVDWYYTRARKAGFDAEHQARGGEHLLAGSRGDAAYYILAVPGHGGTTEVDLVVNGAP